MPQRLQAFFTEACMTTTLSTEPEIPEQEPSRTSVFSLRNLDSDMQLRVRKLHVIDVRWNWIALFWPVVWIVSATFIIHAPASPFGLFVKILCALAIGMAIQAMAILMHEALHGNLFRDTRRDRIAAFLFGIPAFFSGEAYRVAHLNHHRYTRTDKDQDEIGNLCQSKRLYRILFYAWFVLGTLFYFFIVPWKAMNVGSPTARRRIIAEYSAMLLVYLIAIAATLSSGNGLALLWCWLIPAQIAMMASNIRGLSEHLCTSKDEVWTRTRTTKSNWFVSFTMLNLNYHLEHHLFPGVPWYNLQKLHILLQSIYQERDVFIQKSYVAYAWRAFRYGPEQTIRDFSK